MSTKLHFNITKGPSNHQLVDALKYAFDKETPHKATFTMRDCNQEHMNDGSEESPSDVSRKITILSLQHEDASGYSFCFTGTMGILPGESRYSTLYHVSGWYNSKTNKGYIEAE